MFLKLSTKDHYCTKGFLKLSNSIPMQKEIELTVQFYAITTNNM